MDDIIETLILLSELCDESAMNDERSKGDWDREICGVIIGEEED